MLLSMPDELTSWRAGSARAGIEDFVTRVTDSNSDDYVEPAARVAVFDNDGTLWTEKPTQIQLDFTIRRFAELAETDPTLRDRQPYKAAADNDFEWYGAAIVKHYHGDDSDLRLLMGTLPRAFEGVSVEEYDQQVRAFFEAALHPTLQRSFYSCAFLPMVELLRYLEGRGFSTYIASGGDRDFMRPIAERMYGIPPERVIGSALGLTYVESDGAASLLYKSAMDFFDDGPEKPVRIWSRVGRRPILSVGNANGDVPMLAFSEAPGLPSLRIVILHDDSEREFDYTAGAEKLLEVAREQKWLVVSMRDDWATVLVDQNTA